MITNKQKALIKYLEINNLIKGKSTLKKAKKIFDKMSDKEIYKANQYILLSTEKPEFDYLYCSEIGRLDTDETIFDYSNLYEWDKKWWKFQKNSLTELRKDKKYSKWHNINFKHYDDLYMQGDWFRWMQREEYKDKPEMVYGLIQGLREYVTLAINEKIDEVINKKYPNMYHREYNTPIFVKEKGSKYSRMAKSEIRAGGFENELDKLNKLKREKFYKIEKLIKKRIKKYSNYTFTKWDFPDYKTDVGIEDGTKILIIGGLEAAKNISFKSLLKDVHNLEQPIGIVDNLIEEIFKEVKEKYLKKWIKNSTR